MTDLSPHQILLNAYPGKIRSNNEDRVKVVTIRHCENPDDLGHIQERLADILSGIDQERINYIQTSSEQQEAADSNQGVTSDEADNDTEDDIPAAFQRRQENTEQTTDQTNSQDRVDITYDRADIELAELTEHSKPIAVPYPRGYRCPDSCGHYMILSPEDVRDSFDCPHHPRTSLRRFPYVFVCPRCANYEQASPHGALQGTKTGPQPHEVLSDNINRSQEIACPSSDCDGHLHVSLGDRLRSTNFSCPDCDQTFWFHGYCPECDRPATEDADPVRSEMRPKPVDANMTDPLLLDDIESPRGTTLPELREASVEDAASDDRFHWNLDKVARGSSETIQDTFGVNDVFTVEDINTVSAVYGYEATVTAANTNLDEGGRLSRTFSSPDREKRVYLTRRAGRGIVLDLNNDRLAEIVSNGETEDYTALARDELNRLEQMSADEISESESLRLIPLLHAYQHAFYKAAIEEAGLEDFLAAKMLIGSGAIVFAEQRHVGAGGLSQVTMNETGATLLDVFQRTEEVLDTCSRDCDHGCLACTFINDAKCHPFVSREVNGYIPANSLLDRELASEVIRYA